MPRKAPYRPRTDDITQNFNDGYVTIFDVENAAPAGYKPVKRETEQIRLDYQNQTVGVQRYYAARQNQIKIERVIRTPRADVTTQMIAQTEDGKKYRIDFVQPIFDVYPASMDLTLVKYEPKGGDA